ncbi:ArdC-like ssDNA-binding domain-containing protein [Haloarcula sp. 1CSR25-25]|uniref:ImmA/IrrE family metallo-endopeptidase n=1 Tax=Haloarcula sp. 1CSR25-25 TaxID=2862545 RepID=UPI0028950299|nr:ImmA/IrrE family metallo-endopeptidase [Haloarcula sp. 1CSR25-25]MDT3433273.1 ImmA/IrrE family metallo-endopeptidase [Haloarcula sp. 1CSR25-25]
MASNTSSRVQFTSSDTRSDEMHRTIEQWAEELVKDVAKAKTSEEFQTWLDVQSRFHDYSYRNTLLIARQCPEATKVAGYRTWQEEFDRQVQDGEQAIWIWAPIIARQCPGCGNSPNYHENTDCEYDETPPEEWSEGPVAFKPVPVFDISQTEGRPLPELDTEARGNATDLFPAVTGAADTLGVKVAVVDPAEWDHGPAEGICQPVDDEDEYDTAIEIRARESTAAMAAVLIHEYAHALLHNGVTDNPEREKREVEAEAVAYVVGRHFGLDMSGSALYLASWQSDKPETVLDRLDRISRTATEVLEAVKEYQRR